MDYLGLATKGLGEFKEFIKLKCLENELKILPKPELSLPKGRIAARISPTQFSTLL